MSHRQYWPSPSSQSSSRAPSALAAGLALAASVASSPLSSPAQPHLSPNQHNTTPRARSPSHSWLQQNIMASPIPEQHPPSSPSPSPSPSPSRSPASLAPGYHYDAHHSRASSSASSATSQTPFFPSSPSAGDEKPLSPLDREGRGEEREERYSQLQVGGVVGFYMVAALVMVCVNKIILNDTPALVVTTVFIQALVTVLLVYLTSLLRPSLITLPRLSLQTLISLSPVMLGDVAGFTLNAFCLREVDSTFYQVARGLALPFTIGVSAISTSTAPSRQVLLCAFVVTAGFLLGVTPPQPDPVTGIRQLNITPLGVVYGLSASLSVAVQAVLIKRSLTFVHGSALQLAYWRNLGSAVVLLLFMLARGEVAHLSELVRGGQWDYRTFAWGNLVTGVVGFLICVAGTLSVKVTSPVTHMFSSAARSVLQVVVGVGLLGDRMNWQKAASIAVIMGGTVVYGHVQSRGTRKAQGEGLRREKERERDVEKQ